MTNYNDIQIIIMNDGIGSRFWPMLTPDYPKQFIDMMGVGRSLIKLINTTEYQRVLSKALSYTSDKNAIVTIGIKPSRPETGYGYIVA
jgi:mannose-1-phosphate guanylyltransferase